MLRSAWTGQPVQHEGPRFSSRDAVVLPRPVQQNGIPIWAGGNAKRAIRRAVELCDGWCPFPAEGAVTKTARTDELATIEQLKEKLTFALDYAQEIGRSEALTICMARLGGQTVTGPDADHAQQAVDYYSELAAAGVTWTTVAIAAPCQAAFAENVQWFAENIAGRVTD